MNKNIHSSPEFFPFFDPRLNGRQLPWPAKLGISLGVGVCYLFLQYLTLPEKTVFFEQFSWILGIIISTSLLALYIATKVFRDTLATLYTLEVKREVSRPVIDSWLSNRTFLFCGFGFAVCTVLVSVTLGVPADYHIATASLFVYYLGAFAAGFTSGMGLLSIVSCIVLYVRFAPNLEYALDIDNPDGYGGLKKLGDSLWFFGGLIGTLGMLISIYMFNVDWTNMHQTYVQYVFLMWVSLPYVCAISVVLIPGLAVRRYVNYYRDFEVGQLKQQKAQLYSSYKKFTAAEDEDIISEKKELNQKMNEVQDKMEKLRKLRSSHIEPPGSEPKAE